jgi:predicted ATPase
MARFRSSSAPQIFGSKGLSGSVNAPEFYNLKSAGATTSAGSAAGIVSTASIYGGLRENSPDQQVMAEKMARMRAEEKIAAETASAFMEKAGIQADSTLKIAKMNKSASDKAASETRKGGIFSAIGSVAAAAAPLLLASDEDTKHTIDKLENACETLRQLKPVTFFYKEEYSQHPERMHYGFIAQEYQKVMPDATYTDSTTGKLCIDPVELIGLLVRANQELEVRVTRMEAKQVLTTV